MGLWEDRARQAPGLREEPLSQMRDIEEWAGAWGGQEFCLGHGMLQVPARFSCGCVLCLIGQGQSSQKQSLDWRRWLRAGFQGPRAYQGNRQCPRTGPKDQALKTKHWPLKNEQFASEMGRRQWAPKAKHELELSVKEHGSPLDEGHLRQRQSVTDTANGRGRAGP